MNSRDAHLCERHPVLLPPRESVHGLPRQLGVDPKGAELRPRIVLLESRVGAHHERQGGQRQVQAVHMVLAEGGQLDLSVSEYGERAAVC